MPVATIQFIMGMCRAGRLQARLPPHDTSIGVFAVFAVLAAAAIAAAAAIVVVVILRWLFLARL